MKNSVNLSLFLLFLCLLGPLQATENERQFDESAMAEYQEDPAYDYSQNYAQTGSWFNALLAYIFENVGEFFDSTGAEWLVPWVFRLAIFLIILAVIIYLVRNRYSSMFVSERRVVTPSSMIVDKESSINFDQLINEAIKNNEYRLAIRYMFLKSINLLHQKKLIDIKSWKAPYDYMNELPLEKRMIFQEFTDLFEMTWYGEYDAGEAHIEESINFSKQLTE